MKTLFNFRAAFLCCMVICFVHINQLTAHNQAINLKVISTSNISKQLNHTPITYILSNLGESPISSLDLKTQISLASGKYIDLETSAIFAGDPNQNDLLDPNEFWIYTSYAVLPFVEGDSYIVAAGVSGEAGHEKVLKGAGSFINCTKINMDVDIIQDCVVPGEKIDITLTSRLLIDEDAAKNPGTTTIIVGGQTITIDLPVTFYEARDLMISATGLNGGAEFDPFNPPAGVDLTNFCEQAGVDTGRNTSNILDECETIETVRAPCTAPGEDDILCEFPDWQFCYCITIPEDYTDDSFEVVATDDFTVWQAEDTPDNWTDITDDIEASGSDSEEIEVKVSILPVELMSFNAEKKGNAILLDWSTLSETNNSHFNIEKSANGSNFTTIGRVIGENKIFQRAEYEFLDESPFTGINYYRLNQVDFDGTSTKSETVAVEFDAPVRAREFTVAPNPIVNQFSLTGKELNSQMNITIYDIGGRKISDLVVNPDELIDVSDFDGGTYILSVFDENNLNIGTKQILILDK